MIFSNNIESTKTIFIEIEVLLTIVATGAWGGFVSYLLKMENRSSKNAHKGAMSCLSQIVISCFTSFLLSMVAVEKELSLNMILLFAGLGGVFAGPILKIVGLKIKKIITDNSLIK